MRRLDWAQYRAPEFALIDPMTTIAILPTAAVEQHGPHLPVGVDMMIANGMLDELRRQCPDDLDIRILPVQCVGKSNEHLHAAGTLTLGAQTALAAWVEIGLSVARAGVRKIVIVNSHGGNLDLVSILSRELRVRAGMMAVKSQWSSFGQPAGIYPPEEIAFGIHGGDVETSIMLALHPELVDMTAAQNFRSSAQEAPISPIGPVSLGWISSDLNPAGTVGNAAIATAAKGEATIRYQVAGLVAVLQDLKTMSLEGYAPVAQSAQFL
ncbi:MAG: creatininase family protein [Paracoccaceae bacterium]